jgi:hypothetical protein
MKTFEVYVNGHWVKVNWWTFRAWSGGRRVNGIEFLNGNVFYVGSNEISIRRV